ncbi:MAG: hypothetical protein CUN57_00040 [Phototrophicales bacterium]|nr:MAG: hypothetical protein CUN57_00040 [Phototrophicales bacterium]
MKYSFLTTLLTTLLVLALLTTGALAAPLTTNTASRNYIVGVSASAQENRLLSHLERYGEIVNAYPEVNEYVVRITSPRSLDSLRRSKYVTYVHPDVFVYPASVPNDPLYDQQWYLPHVGAPFAWNISSVGSLVAVIDTGINLDHEDLSIVGGWNAITHPGNNCTGGNISEASGIGHGTRVAGIIGAVGNNAVGITGVMWDAQLLIARVTNRTDGLAPLSRVLAAAREAAECGAKVVSVSYSGVEQQTVQVTGEYIKSLDSLLVYSAGNGNINFTSFDHEDVIVVGATNEFDGRADFSNYGTAIDIVAPGVNMFSTYFGNGYVVEPHGNGTSYSTALVAGALGLLRGYDDSLTAQEAEDRLYSAAIDLGDEQTFGHGLLFLSDLLPPLPLCSDGLDNDGDGATDFPADFSCSSADDDDETNPMAACQDGIDNDGDGFVDLDDLGCYGLQDNDEFNVYNCVDGDNGTFAYTASQVCDNFGCVQDMCVSPLFGYQFVEEWVCVNGIKQKILYDCPTGCDLQNTMYDGQNIVAGACAGAQPTSCIDPDGPDGFFTNTTVTTNVNGAEIQSITDWCLPGNSSVVREYWCDEWNQPAYTDFSCDSGCVDGRCLP